MGQVYGPLELLQFPQRTVEQSPQDFDFCTAPRHRLRDIAETSPRCARVGKRRDDRRSTNETYCLLDQRPGWSVIVSGLVKGIAKHKSLCLRGADGKMLLLAEKADAIAAYDAFLQADLATRRKMVSKWKR